VIPLLAAPELPLHTAGPYVVAAYIVFVAMILVYVAIMAVRLGRNQRDIAELTSKLREREADADDGQLGWAEGDSPGAPGPGRETEVTR
jgi:hypothetical protein